MIASLIASLRGFAFGVFTLSLSGCASFGGFGGGGPTGNTLQSILEPGPSALHQTPSLDSEDVLAFYRARNFRPAWTGDAEAERHAQEARAVLVRADEQGLTAENYAFAPPHHDIAESLPAAEYEFAVTRAVLRYARDVRTGRVQLNDIYRDVELPASPFNTAVELRHALDEGTVTEFLTTLPPPHPEYHRLAAALKTYRAFAESPSSPQGRMAFDADNPEFHLLAARLALEDSELAALTAPSENDIRAAVRRYQTRKRLSSDGIVGPATWGALQADSEARIERIAANMERWRWLPRRFEAHRVMVNVPAQTLQFVSNDEVKLSSRVVVGAERSQTPILRTEAIAVKANPPWNIPGDIAARDLLPYMRRNANYLQERNMVLVDTLETDPYGHQIDWSKVEPAQFFYSVRQLPGPETGLGALMLDMPNGFDVYLHDTPAKQFFALDDRALSNGCVRVQDIFELASLALTHDADAGTEPLRAAIESGETQFLPLNTPLPVYMLYWTATDSPNGVMTFPADRYDRDEALINAILAHSANGVEVASAPQ